MTWTFLYTENVTKERALNGDLACQVKYVQKKLTENDENEAIKYLTLAAEQGHCQSCVLLGDLYFKWSSLQSNFSEEERAQYFSLSVRWYCKASGVGIAMEEFKEKDTKRSPKALNQLSLFIQQKKKDNDNILERLDRIELLTIAANCPIDEGDNKEYVKSAAGILNVHYSQLWISTKSEDYKNEATKYAKLAGIVKETRTYETPNPRVSFESDSASNPPKKKTNVWKYVAVGAGILTLGTIIFANWLSVPKKADGSKSFKKKEHSLQQYI